jgi:hypothetical protein
MDKISKVIKIAIGILNNSRILLFIIIINSIKEIQINKLDNNTFPSMILKYFKCILAFLQKNREDISHYIIKRKNKLVYKLVCFCVLLDLTIHWINKRSLYHTPAETWDYILGIFAHPRKGVLIHNIPNIIWITLKNICFTSSITVSTCIKYK